jgi:putative inorganic carbon (hco3(-)) transporter
MSPTTQASVDTFWHRSILICFHFLLLATPLFFTWFNDELFEFNKMILTYAVTVVVGSLWVGRMISEKQLFVRRTIFDLPIAVFFLSQVVSTIFSINQHTSFLGYYSRSNGGLVSFFCYITLFYAFISNLQKRDLPKLFFSTFLSAFLVSLIAIPEHFGHSLSCLMINVYRYRGQALPSGWFGQFYDVSCWIQDVQTRVYATFGQPNWLAAYAILLIPIGTVLSVTDQFALKVRNSTLPVRLFYGVSTLSLLLSLVFTKSRSGILGLALGMLVLVLGFGSVWFRDFHHRKMTLIFAGACMIAILFFGTPFSKNYGEQWLSQHPEVKQQEESPVAPPTTPNRLDIGGTDSGEIRQIVWSGALKVWQRYPLFGSGVETFAYSYYKDRPVEHNLVSEWDFLYNKAHNEFLNFLATTGLFGLATYVVMVSTFTLFPLWSVWRKGKEEKADQQHPADRILFSSALASGLLALSISNFFGFSTVMVNVLLFLLPAFFVVKYLPLQMKTWSFAEEEPQEDGEPTKNTEEDTSRILAVISYVILFCVAAGLLFSVYSLWRADYLYTRGKQYIHLSKENE